MRFVALLLMLLVSSLVARASIAGDEIVQIEHLWLTQDIHASAENLCQDGRYIYFNSIDDCNIASPSWNCEESLKITPIRFIEKVELPSGEAVSHFYNVKTTYDLMVYELVSDGPIKNYDLIMSKQVPLPICEGMTALPPEKVRRIRQVNPEEWPIIKGLVDSGVTIVNSPFGKFNPSSLKKYETLSSFGEQPKLKSPLCSDKLDYDDLVQKASGEWSGNGGILKLAALSSWQQESFELLVRKSKDSQNAERYEFFCLNEAPNVQ